MEISSLDDIQKLEAKDLREILKSNSKSTGGIRADLKFMLCWCDTSFHQVVEKTENLLQMSRAWNKTRATSDTKQLW